MAKECNLCTGKLSLGVGGLPRNSVVRISDHPNMTSAVYHGCKATNQTNLFVRLTFLLKNMIIWTKHLMENSSVYSLNMSHVVRNPAFCICENKEADQLSR